MARRQRMALPAAMALSGLNEEYFSDGLNDMFNQGAVLLKSPSASSFASSDDTYSQESGISSMSSETSVVTNLAPYFDLLYNKSQIELKAIGSTEEKKKETQWHEPKTEVNYQNRNILDLGSNVQWNKWDFQPAKVRHEIKYFFENRSQYSRVLGAQIPEHKMATCPFPDCSFNEPVYY